MTDPARRIHRSGQEGFSTLFALILLVVGSIFVLAMVGRLEVLVRQRAHERVATTAFWAAQAGVEKARVSIARDPAWPGGTVAVGRAHAEVRVSRVPGDDALRAVRVLGVDPGFGPDVSRGQRTLVVVLRLGGALPEVVEWREEP